jgi:DNA-binding PadR family transcriptional regulator
MLRLGASSGYDIKQLVDLSGRHFLTINYPQIYPELRRLEEAGLVRGKADRASGRGRTVYQLTKAGKRELDRWLTESGPAALEIRDIGLLKIFVADSSDVVRAQLEAVRKRSEEMIDELEGHSRPAAKALEERVGNPFPLVTVDFSLNLHRGIIRTCRKLERELVQNERRG